MNDVMFQFAPILAMVSILFWIVVLGLVVMVTWRLMRAHERIAASLSEIAAHLRDRPPA